MKRWINIFILIICLSSAVESVTWVIRTDPVVMGSSLKLFCNTSGSDCVDCASQWYGDNKLLSFYDKVVDPDLYAVIHEKDGFTLTIKNLTRDHIHKHYECSYGFHVHSRNLTLPSNYEHHPTKETTKTTHRIDGSTLYINIIFMAVRPKPVCSVILDSKNLSSALMTTIFDKGLFYEVSLGLNHTSGDECNGRLVIHCSIGRKNDTVMDSDIKFECDDTLLVPTIGIAVTVIASLIIISIIITVRRMRVSERCGKKEKSGSENDVVDIPLQIPTGRTSDLPASREPFLKNI